MRLGQLDRRRFDDPFIQQALDQIRLANDGDRPQALHENVVLQAINDGTVVAWNVSEHVVAVI